MHHRVSALQPYRDSVVYQVNRDRGILGYLFGRSAVRPGIVLEAEETRIIILRLKKKKKTYVFIMAVYNVRAVEIVRNSVVMFCWRIINQNRWSCLHCLAIVLSITHHLFSSTGFNAFFNGRKKKKSL